MSFHAVSFHAEGICPLTSTVILVQAASLSDRVYIYNRF